MTAAPVDSRIYRRGAKRAAAPAPELELAGTARRDAGSSTDDTMIGIASIPEREHTLEQVVAALAPQADRVCVSLNGYTRRPAWLDRFPNVEATLRPPALNGGDAEKFAALDDWHGYVLTCDDDVDYPPTYVADTLARLARERPGTMVSYHGGTTAGWNGSHGAATLKRHACLGRLDRNDYDVNVLGTGALAFHADHVPIWRDVFRYPNMADVLLACHAQQLGIPMLVLAHQAGYLKDLAPAGPSIYESNRANDGSRLDTRELRRRELGRVDWTAPRRRPRVRVSIATCQRPRLLAGLLDDLERETRTVDVDVAVFEDPSPDTSYRELIRRVRRRVEWYTMPEHLGRIRHAELVTRQLEACRQSPAEWFAFLPDDVTTTRFALARAIATWNRLADPATLTLWRLKDLEGLPNWTGLPPDDRGEAFEVYHVDGNYLTRRPTLELLGYRVALNGVRGRITSSGVGREMSMRLHGRRRRMYRVSSSLTIPVPTPSVMNPDVADRLYPDIAL